jgi:hypothetical protein
MATSTVQPLCQLAERASVRHTPQVAGRPTNRSFAGTPETRRSPQFSGYALRVKIPSFDEPPAWAFPPCGLAAVPDCLEGPSDGTRRACREMAGILGLPRRLTLWDNGPTG